MPTALTGRTQIFATPLLPPRPTVAVPSTLRRRSCFSAFFGMSFGQAQLTRFAAVYWKRRRDFHRRSHCRIVDHLVIYSTQYFKLLPDIPLLFYFGSGSSQCGGELMHRVRSLTSKAAEATAPRYLSLCSRVTLDLLTHVSCRSLSGLNSVLILLSLVRVVICSKIFTVARTVIRRLCRASRCRRQLTIHWVRSGGKSGTSLQYDVYFNSIVCCILLPAY